MLQISNLRLMFPCLDFILHISLSCLHKGVKHRGLPINPFITNFILQNKISNISKENEAIFCLLGLSNNLYVLLLVFVLPCFIFFSSGSLKLLCSHLCSQTSDCPASASHVLWFHLCTSTFCGASDGANGYMHARKAFYQLNVFNHLLRLQVFNTDNIDSKLDKWFLLRIVIYVCARCIGGL